jgi:hypothetical protein
MAQAARKNSNGISLIKTKTIVQNAIWEFPLPLKPKLAQSFSKSFGALF